MTSTSNPMKKYNLPKFFRLTDWIRDKFSSCNDCAFINHKMSYTCVMREYKFPEKLSSGELRAITCEEFRKKRI